MTMLNVSTATTSPGATAIIAFDPKTAPKTLGVYFIVAIVFGLVWGLANTFGWWLSGSSRDFVTTLRPLVYESLLPMLLLVPAIAVADALARRRPGRVVFHIAAALVAAVGGEALFALTAPLLNLDTCECSMDRWPPGLRISNMLPDSILICGFVTAGYCYRRRSQQRLARLHAAQIERAQLTRRTLESRLQAMQACIEPEFLFDTLAQVESMHLADAKGAGRMLDDLIVYLRAALPQLTDTTSTVGKECELVSAYLNIRKTGAVVPVSFDIAVPAEVRDARMPPMILLPLIDHALQCGLQSARRGGALRIGFGFVGRTLRMTLGYDGAEFLAGAPGEAEVARIRDRLATLYGDAAGVELHTDDRQGTHLIMEIPHESADGDHR